MVLGRGGARPIGIIRGDPPAPSEDRGPMRTALLTLACLALALPRPGPPPAGSPKPRNVVFILTDDHRYDALGFLGHPFLETPHLDALARGGAHGANAFVTTSLCSP